MVLILLSYIILPVKLIDLIPNNKRSPDQICLLFCQGRFFTTPTDIVSVEAICPFVVFHYSSYSALCSSFHLLYHIVEYYILFIDSLLEISEEQAIIPPCKSYLILRSKQGFNLFFRQNISHISNISYTHTHTHTHIFMIFLD